MKARLYVDVEFDGRITDAESVASAADHLMDTARSTPGILDEYGDPRFGGFYVLTEDKESDNSDFPPPPWQDEPEGEGWHEFEDENGEITKMCLQEDPDDFELYEVQTYNHAGSYKGRWRHCDPPKAEGAENAEAGNG